MIRRALPLFVLLAAPLHAHPGHGADGGSHSLQHYLFESPHSLPWLMLGVLVLGALHLARRARAGR
ncbi:MAG: hypothetical protein IPN34_25735 [Planctomycetes bacterium]|nr:hypothetical protein [Planctomycetota bacterium]